MANKITYSDKIGLVDKTTRVNQWWDDDANEIKTKHNLNDDRITAVEAGQISGVKSYATLALLQASGDETLNVVYKVTNDPTPSNNGYYHWDGAAYIQDEVLNQDLIDDIAYNEAVSINKAKGENLITLGVAGKFLSIDGVETANAAYNISDYIPIASGELIYITGNYGGASYHCYYDNSFVLIGKGVNTQFIPHIIGASYVRVSYSSDLTKAFKIKNLIDYNDPDVANGYFLSNLGVETENNIYNISGYIPIAEGQVFYKGDAFGGGSYTCYYDNSKVLIASTAINKQVIPWITGASYIRVTYGYDDSVLYESEQFMLLNYLKRFVVTDSIANNAVTEDKTSFFNNINLFNYQAVGLDEGYFVNTTGTLSANDSYAASEYIPINPYDVIRKTEAYGGAAYSAFYDSSFNFISDSQSVEPIIVAPSTAAYVRVSTFTASKDTYMLVRGTVLPIDYVAFGTKAIEDDMSNYTRRIKAQGGNDSSITETSTLSSGSTLEDDEFPLNLKKGLAMSFYAEFSTFPTSIYFGKGYNLWRGYWFEIDSTNIVLKSYDTVENIMDTQSHGLTFDTFIKCSFTVDNEGIANLILQTITGYFKTTFDYDYEGCNTPFLTTIGQDLTDVKMTCGCSEFQRQVWIFGDSYVSVADVRWPYYLHDFGYFNFLLNGLSGGTSEGLYSDLIKCLKYGTPKYIVWLLGMNDSYANFVTYFDKVKELCIGLDIELIVSTIPTVPIVDNEAKKTYVESSGLRYVDFYKAVGADALGAWYSGYLYTDQVHPTALGAQALATQILVDFPEIMQY